MSAALAAPAPVVTPPSGLTLERYLDSVLLEALEHGHADCPLCGCAMSAAAAELRCSGCGSRLS
jgi:tRNA(Ile2) C34 agmatinyltransferase TiaS